MSFEKLLPEEYLLQNINFALGPVSYQYLIAVAHLVVAEHVLVSPEVTNDEWSEMATKLVNRMIVQGLLFQVKDAPSRDFYSALGNRDNVNNYIYRYLGFGDTEEEESTIHCKLNSNAIELVHGIN